MIEKVRNNAWVEFLSDLNNKSQDLLLKSILSQSKLLKIDNDFVTIQVSNNSRFFQDKILAEKENWNPIFQNVFPSKELKIFKAE